MPLDNIDKLCMSCFTPHPEMNDACPVCGYQGEAEALPLHHLRPRTILNGKYLVGRVLGEGGFGITYIGWDLNLEIKVAIKEYYPVGFVTREITASTSVQPFTGTQGDFFLKGRERFVDEARSLAKFRSLPGIVTVNDFFLENGTAYIVMEYIDGQTLKSYLNQMGGKLPAAQVFDMMRPVMSSLAQVHAVGMIHRDISPDNIMLDRSGYVKLLDFGAARDFADSGNRSLSIMLKPGFAPEEQYRSRGKQGPWTDVYALSATMYRAITGVTPDESPERMRSDQVKKPSEFVNTISPAQEKVLLKGMAVLQENRFQSMNELAHALAAAPVSPVMAPVPPAVEDKGRVFGTMESENGSYAPQSECPNKAHTYIKKHVWTRGHKVAAAAVACAALIVVLIIALNGDSRKGDASTAQQTTPTSSGTGLQASEKLSSGWEDHEITLVGVDIFPETKALADAISTVTGRTVSLTTVPYEAYIDYLRTHYQAGDLPDLIMVSDSEDSQIYSGNITNSLGADYNDLFASQWDGGVALSKGAPFGEEFRTLLDGLKDPDSALFKAFYAELDTPSGETNNPDAAASPEIGNTPGNINAVSQVVEKERWIYFCNQADNYKLYKASADGTQKQAVTSVSSNGYNIVGDWAYYTNNADNTYLYRIRTDGTGNERVLGEKASNITVVGDKIYYIREADQVLCCMSADGSNIYESLSDVCCATYSEGYIYVIQNLSNNGRHSAQIIRIEEDGYFERFYNFAGYELGNLIVMNDWAYYTASEGGVYRYELKDNNDTSAESKQVKLTGDKASYLNVDADGWIYYSNDSDGGSLWKMRWDGSERTKLSSEKSTHINITSHWIYYYSWGKMGFYRMEKDGSDIEYAV